MDIRTDRLESNIGYTFKNKKLLLNALTHSSYINENREKYIHDNERMEFFGDAVLEFYVSEYLFEKYRGKQEGSLTKMRSSLVCEPSLAVCAEKIELGDFLLMGKGEEHTGGRHKDSVTSDAFEALICAIYLDGGHDAVKEFIYRHVIEALEKKEVFHDAKSKLKEMIQQAGGGDVEYEVTGEEGPPHDRMFYVTAMLSGKEIGKGHGHSKKAAQQEAALDAMRRWKA